MEITMDQVAALETELTSIRINRGQDYDYTPNVRFELSHSTLFVYVGNDEEPTLIISSNGRVIGDYSN